MGAAHDGFHGIGPGGLDPSGLAAAAHQAGSHPHLSRLGGGMTQVGGVTAPAKAGKRGGAGLKRSASEQVRQDIIFLL